MRNALQFSLNIPAVKALALNGIDRVYEMAERFGLDFQLPKRQAGLSMALGTLEVHPLDLTTAYATLANAGTYLGHAAILSVRDVAGQGRAAAVRGARTAARSSRAQAAYVVTDILAGNTDPAQNPVWGR